MGGFPESEYPAYKALTAEDTKDAEEKIRSNVLSFPYHPWTMEKSPSLLPGTLHHHEYQFTLFFLRVLCVLSGERVDLECTEP